MPWRQCQGTIPKPEKEIAHPTGTMTSGSALLAITEH